jgi:hypothetical protein
MFLFVIDDSFCRMCRVEGSPGRKSIDDPKNRRSAKRK